MKTLVHLLLISIVFLNFSNASASLIGTWKTQCTVFGQNNRHSFSSIVTINASKILIDFKMFADQNCTIHNLTSNYEGAYSTSVNYGEGSKIDFTSTEVAFTLSRQEIVDLYNDPNSLDGCGIKNWQLNILQDVSGRFCRPFQMPTRGKQVYDIFNVSNGELKFGFIPFRWNEDSSSRPTQLSEIVYLKTMH